MPLYMIKGKYKTFLCKPRKRNKSKLACFCAFIGYMFYLFGDCSKVLIRKEFAELVATQTRFEILNVTGLPSYS